MVFCDINLSITEITAVAGVVVSIFIGTTMVTLHNRNRTQRDFFMKEVESLKNDYAAFINDIKSSKLAACQIANGFLNFTNRINMLDDVIGAEYHLTHNNVFKKHGELQTTVTELQSIEEQFNRDAVTLTNGEQITVMSNFQPLHRSMIELIVEINKAGKCLPWERDDFLNH